MQFNNPNGKWQEEMPYMIINLEYDKDIYLGKDTIVEYTWEEDKTCKFLEVNEVIESTEFRNWTLTKGKSIIESDLVFSPTQSNRTPLCGVEGIRKYHKRQRKGLRRLKEKIPKSFFL